MRRTSQLAFLRRLLGCETDKPEEQADSLCWNCLRVTWGCLCEWPLKKPRWVTTLSTGVKEGGVELKIVVKCPLYWPEI